MAKVENLKKLVNALRTRAAKARDDNVSVLVGYTASYAIFLHENRAMKWRGFPRDRSIRKIGDIAVTDYAPIKGKHGLFWGPTGRAGFLLDVMREMADELRRVIVESLLKKRTMAQSLLVGGLRLQRESQKNVPVEYGNLRASAFTRLERK